MPARRRLAAWTAAALLALAACGGDEQVVATEAGDVRVSREGEEVTVRSEEAGIEGRFGPGAELPEDFPDDVPLPSDAEVVGVMTSREEGAMVSLRSATGVGPLHEALRRDLGAEGWTLEEDAEVMGQRLLTATKEGRSLTVQMMGTDEGTRLMVHVGTESG
ncbi:MAG: hypothetical protein R3263_02320 [Myxococcota bacterium]|nr:hypothetical protein [Myxococcota bacterium]